MFFFIMLIICVSLSLTSCRASSNPEETTHSHSYMDEWSYDDVFHWHMASCEHIDEVKDYGNHQFEDGICVICGFIEEDERELIDMVWYSLSPDNKSYIVTGIEASSESSLEVNIVSTVNGLPVSEIGNHAFICCSNLKSIQIPASITSIGDSAFSGCSGLVNIDIPSSVTRIGWFAFSGCSNLISIDIPSSVTSIGSYAFNGCSSLESISLPFIGDGGNEEYLGYIFGASSYSNNSSYVPSSLKTVIILEGSKNISDYAFSNCSGLASIVIPSSVTSIGLYAFSNCTCDIVWDNPTITSIGSYALSEYKGSNIDIPSSVTSIGDSAFSGCSGLTSIVIPSSVTSIERDAFKNCTCDIVWDNPTITSIGYYAFSEYKGSYIEIPTSVTSIEVFAFGGCSNLVSIVIPSNVTSIGDYAFAGCSSLIIYYKGTTSQWNSICNPSIITNTVFFYMDTQPTDTNYNYWYYNENGDIVLW